MKVSKKELMFSDEWYRKILPFDKLYNNFKTSTQITRLPKHTAVLSGKGLKI